MTDVMAPMIQHLDRSKSAFERWLGSSETEVIRSANQGVLDLLSENAELIPTAYRAEAKKLTEHYDAWFREYNRVMRVMADTTRDENQVFVFVGPQGSPFPGDAERSFRGLYRELLMRVLEMDSTSASAAAGLSL